MTFGSLPADGSLSTDFPTGKTSIGGPESTSHFGDRRAPNVGDRPYLQSAFLLRAGLSLSGDPEIRPSLKSHFQTVLDLLHHNTEASLQIALTRLESATLDTWTPDAKDAWLNRLTKERRRNLETLRAYGLRGLFPVNDRYSSQPVPVFVDHLNTACAVGHLMRESGAGDAVDLIVKQNNFVYVTDVVEGPLNDWILTSGLTREEAALIQPAYIPQSFSTATQPNGNYLVALSQLVHGVVRLNPDDSFDKMFQNESYSRFRFLAVQPDGHIIVAGRFTVVEGESRPGIARLRPDLNLDPGFAPQFDFVPSNYYSEVLDLLIQPDGKIVVAGMFGSADAGPTARMVRLHPDGSLDSAFESVQPETSRFIRHLALQADGKIIVAGDFSTLDGAPRPGLARLNADGSLDDAFVPTPPLTTHAIAVQPDGKILIAGSRAPESGDSGGTLYRLLMDGATDSSFLGGANATIYALAIQADGKILWGGLPATGSSQIIGRLEPNGDVDSGFHVGLEFSPGTGPVASITLLAHGEILVGGTFEVGTAATRRLHNAGSPVDQLDHDGTRIRWSRDGTAPAFLRTTFEAKGEGADWTMLGPGVRVDGGWELSVLDLPESGMIRARGYPAGSRSGSNGIVERRWMPDTVNRPAIALNRVAFGEPHQPFQFTVETDPGHTVHVEGSSNLKDWSPVATYNYDTPSFLFSDRRNVGYPALFYRVRSQR